MLLDAPSKLLQVVDPTAAPTTRLVAPEVAPQQGPSQLLAFRLGSEEYGISLLAVQEIRSYEAPTRIANTPSHIKGVLNLRGEVVPVIDLRLHLGMGDVDYTIHTITIILNVGGYTVGMIVDAVSDVVALEADQVKPAPEFNELMGPGYITGIGTLGQGDARRMLILIHANRLMCGVGIGLSESALH